MGFRARPPRSILPRNSSPSPQTVRGEMDRHHRWPLGYADRFLVVFVAQIVVHGHVDVLWQEPHASVAEHKLTATWMIGLETHFGIPVATRETVVLAFGLGDGLRAAGIEIDGHVCQGAPPV